MFTGAVFSVFIKLNAAQYLNLCHVLFENVVFDFSWYIPNIFTKLDNLFVLLFVRLLFKSSEGLVPMQMIQHKLAHPVFNSSFENILDIPNSFYCLEDLKLISFRIHTSI